MPNETSYQDAKGNKYAFANIQENFKSIPSTAEVTYFILFATSCYLGLTALLFTTTNAGIKSLMVLILTIANWAILIGALYYVAKLTKAFLNILLSRR